MILRLILALIFIAIAFSVIKNIRKQPPELRKKLTIKYLIYGVIGVLVLLVAFGKVHWITAAIAAMVPVAQRLLGAGIKFMPFLSSLRQQKQQQQEQANQQKPRNSNAMSVDEALDVFGLKSVDSLEQITKRHRELMQKMHPDRGGSDFLAAQINEAKEVLVDHVKNVS